MRKAFILTLMAATAVTPLASAVAQDRGRDRPQVERQNRAERPARAERAQRSEARQQRAPRAQRVERAPIAQRQERSVSRQQSRSFDNVARTAPNRAYRQGQQRSTAIDRRNAGTNNYRDAQIARSGDRRTSYNRSGNYNPNNTYNRGGTYNRNSNYNRSDAYNRNGNYNRGGTYNRNGNHNGQWSNNRGGSGSWNRNWRNDRRYDWQRYRNSNRNIYHVGRYYSPYRNHHYNRFSVGLFLGSAFYGQNYWLGNPSYYRLPPAYPGTQWVRYYDDVMLVDVYTGEVLDVIYNFFW